MRIKSSSSTLLQRQRGGKSVASPVVYVPTPSPHTALTRGRHSSLLPSISSGHLADKSVTWVDLSSPGVIGPRPLMGRLPHILDVDIPRAVLELADLSNVYPAPIVTN